MLKTQSNPWQPLALSEDVSDAPISVLFAGEPVAVFRDSAGKACAIEDYCPHRRAPLSLGKVIEGQIRCPYHGWTFDGTSGACTDIPNLGEGERVPESYCVRVYQTAEQGGVVYARVGAEDDAALPEARPDALPMHGSFHATMSPEAYMAVLMDGPQLLFTIKGIGVTDFLLGDPVRDGDRVRIDRPADKLKRRRDKEPSRWTPDYRYALRSDMDLSKGQALFDVLDTSEQVLASVLVVVQPGLRGTSRIFWRAGTRGTESGPLSSARFSVDFDKTPPGDEIALLLQGPSRLIYGEDIQDEPEGLRVPA